MTKRIFTWLYVVRTKMVYVKNEYSQLFYKDFSDIYSLPNIIQAIKSRRIKCPGYMACVEGRRGAYRVLVRQPQAKRTLGRPRNRWDDIKMDLQEMVLEGVDWLIPLKKLSFSNFTPFNIKKIHNSLLRSCDMGKCDIILLKTGN